MAPEAWAEPRFCPASDSSSSERLVAPDAISPESSTSAGDGGGGGPRLPPPPRELTRGAAGTPGLPITPWGSWRGGHDTHDTPSLRGDPGNAGGGRGHAGHGGKGRGVRAGAWGGHGGLGGSEGHGGGAQGDTQGHGGTGGDRRGDTGGVGGAGPWWGLPHKSPRPGQDSGPPPPPPPASSGAPPSPRPSRAAGAGSGAAAAASPSPGAEAPAAPRLRPPRRLHGRQRHFRVSAGRLLNVITRRAEAAEDVAILKAPRGLWGDAPSWLRALPFFLRAGRCPLLSGPPLPVGRGRPGPTREAGTRPVVPADRPRPGPGSAGSRRLSKRPHPSWRPPTPRHTHHGGSPQTATPIMAAHTPHPPPPHPSWRPSPPSWRPPGRPPQAARKGEGPVEGLSLLLG